MKGRNKFPFAVICDCLHCGREIEFAYHGKQYSITNSQGVWNFCCDTDHSLLRPICPFDEREALVAFLKEERIDGVPLSVIFDDMGYDEACVCIL